MADPALALLELSSIAVGYFLCDAIVKRAPVKVLRAEAVTPGKFLLLFGGDVASVDESYTEAIALAEGDLLDSFFLPHVHEQILPMLAGAAGPAAVDAVGVYEVLTVASAIQAADKALKDADVRLIEFRAAQWIGGKAYFTLTGSQTEVEAALEAADGVCVAARTRVRRVVIPNPHEEFAPIVLRPGGLPLGSDP